MFPLRYRYHVNFPLLLSIPQRTSTKDLGFRSSRPLYHRAGLEPFKDEMGIHTRNASSAPGLLWVSNRVSEKWSIPSVSMHYGCPAILFLLWAGYNLHSTSLYVDSFCISLLATYHYIVHDFKLSLLSESLRSLQMDWGIKPYLWRGSQQEGPTFLRSFPHLERFTLVITISNWAWDDGEKEILMEITKHHTAAQMQREQSWHPEWRMPMIYFHCRKDRIDWSIHSIAKSLLPKNCSNI